VSGVYTAPQRSALWAGGHSGDAKMTIHGRPTQAPTMTANYPLRAMGRARAVFARIGATTAPARVFDSGGLKLRFPRSSGPCEAVLVNTGGGMAGGDQAAVDLVLEAGAEVLATTQSAEKIYRAEGRPTRIETRLTLSPGASLIWAPQETILFDHAHLVRRLEADVAGDASLLLIESLVFGRVAMGEEGQGIAVGDHWRIRRDGKLAFAEALRLQGASTALGRPAVGRGARAGASFLFMAPNAEASLEKVRESLVAVAVRDGAPLEAGASALDGFLMARALSPDPARLRAAVVAVMMTLTGRRPPRVWQ
jgi:urease accessory protein